MKTTFTRVVLLAVALFAPAAWAKVNIEHWTQPGGAKVYLVQSHSLPMVDVQIDFDAGSRRDPADKAGLAGVTAAMASRGLLADGGDPALDENGLSEAWADLGASFGASASADRMGFSLRSLTYPDLLPKVVALAARQLALPAFAPDIWQREREQLVASIKEADTRPATIASKAFATAVYGAHPYGYQMTEASLGRIDVAAMRSLYARAIEPCRAKVSIVGDVSRAQADDLVGALLARLQQGRCKDALPAVAEVAPMAQPGATQAIAFDSAQAHVLSCAIEAGEPTDSTLLTVHRHPPTEGVTACPCPPSPAWAICAQPCRDCLYSDFWPCFSARCSQDPPPPRSLMAWHRSMRWTAPSP